MRRFGLKSLLLVVTYVALWVSTFSDYSGVEDVRAFVMTSIFVASGIAAYAYAGRTRAFWLGFFATLLVFGNRRVLDVYGAKFSWVAPLSRQLSEFWAVFPPDRGQHVMTFYFTLVYGTTLIAAVLIGLLSVFIYSQAQGSQHRLEA